MMKSKHKVPAFSMVELILYIGITSIIVGSLLNFSISLVQVRGDAEFEREVLENARFVGDAISRQIRDAEDVSSVTESHPGSITLDGDGADVITIDTALDGSRRYLQVNTGSGAEAITSDKVNVTNFSLIELQQGSGPTAEPKNIQFSITIESIDGESSFSFRSAVGIRE